MQVAILIFMIFNFICNLGIIAIVTIAINNKVKEMKKLKLKNNACNYKHKK